MQNQKATPINIANSICATVDPVPIREGGSIKWFDAEFELASCLLFNVLCGTVLTF